MESEVWGDRVLRKRPRASPATPRMSAGALSSVHEHPPLSHGTTSGGWRLGTCTSGTQDTYLRVQSPASEKTKAVFSPTNSSQPSLLIPLAAKQDVLASDPCQLDVLPPPLLAQGLPSTRAFPSHRRPAHSPRPPLPQA